ncbi:hypothetical protein ACKU05_026135 [Klebsiella pneumoniae]
MTSVSIFGCSGWPGSQLPPTLGKTSQREGMPIGLYRDLAVGVAEAGQELGAIVNCTA